MKEITEFIVKGDVTSRGINVLTNQKVHPQFVFWRAEGERLISNI